MTSVSSRRRIGSSSTAPGRYYQLGRSVRLALQLLRRDCACTLIVSGEADLTVADDIYTLGATSLAEPTTHTLLIELSAVTFIDSTAIGALVRLRNLAVGPDKRLELVKPSPRVTRILKLAGLDGAFDII